MCGHNNTSYWISQDPSSYFYTFSWLYSVARLFLEIQVRPGRGGSPLGPQRSSITPCPPLSPFASMEA